MKLFDVRQGDGELITGLSGQDVVELAKSGRLSADSLIRQQDQEGWRLVKSVPQIAAHISTPQIPQSAVAVSSEQRPHVPQAVPRSKRSAKAIVLIAGLLLAVLGAAAGSAAWFLRSAAVVPQWAELLEPDPDPDVVTSETLRSAIKATGYAWRVRDKATQIEMVLIPPGTFQMGCSESSQGPCASDETPVHLVTLTSPFYIGRYEVTQAQWAARTESNPSGFQKPSALVPADQVPNRPVEEVTWMMIQGFLGATGMRLPTEAEWEYACRAGTKTVFHGSAGRPTGTNDDSLLGSIAWFNGNSSEQTHPVGQRAGNGFGLHDMSGNVAEWVSDFYSPTYYEASPAVDPLGPSSGSDFVLRGGSWKSKPQYCGSSCRGSRAPANGHHVSFGFRVARNP